MYIFMFSTRTRLSLLPPFLTRKRTQRRTTKQEHGAVPYIKEKNATKRKRPKKKTFSSSWWFLHVVVAPPSSPQRGREES